MKVTQRVKNFLTSPQEEVTVSLSMISTRSSFQNSHTEPCRIHRGTALFAITYEGSPSSLLVLTLSGPRRGTAPVKTALFCTLAAPSSPSSLLVASCHHLHLPARKKEGNKSSLESWN